MNEVYTEELEDVFYAVTQLNVRGSIGKIACPQGRVSARCINRN
jgi:hypothetical protein